jgi:hypothetical protein
LSVKIEEAKNLKQNALEFLETFTKEFNLKLSEETANKRQDL